MNHTPRWVPADFDTALLEADPASGSYVLKVAGILHQTGELCLKPRLIAAKKYLVQPEYAEIKVEFDAADAIFPEEESYKASLSLTGICGSKGVEVVGRSKSMKVDLPSSQAKLARDRTDA